jgi:hypothetical protein
MNNDKIQTGNKTLLLLPISGIGTPVTGTPATSDSINWQCHADSVPTGDVFTTSLGTLSSKFVPSNCRLLPISGTGTPVTGTPTTAVSINADSAPTGDVFTASLGTLSSKFVPSNCRLLLKL